MIDDARYFLNKIETGENKLRSLQQLHMLVETALIIERINDAKNSK